LRFIPRCSFIRLSMFLQTWNLARRCVDQAKPNEALVSEATWAIA
jgi:hypothetical protein